jgi:predicted oxidoreductase
MQWFLGDRDEDHAAAVLFNINGAEYVREKMRTKAKCDIEFPVETRMSAREFIANQKKGDGGTLPSL